MSQKKDNLETITEVDFERGLVKMLRYYNTQISEIYNMLSDIQYYKERDYKIYHYLNNKENTYSYFAEERKAGFQYENNKTQKEQSIQTKSK